MGGCLDDCLQGRDARGLRDRTMDSTRVAPARTWRAYGAARGQNLTVKSDGSHKGLGTGEKSCRLQCNRDLQGRRVSGGRHLSGVANGVNRVAPLRLVGLG